MCGGESRRMGKDKGLLEIKNTPWAKIIANIFVDVGIEYALSINPSQNEAYARIFGNEKLVIDNDVPVEGPLKGLLSIHEKKPVNDLLLIACDMLNMDTATVNALIECYRSTKDVHYIAYKVQNFTEPFCGIYTSSGLKNIYGLAMKNSLQSFSLQKIINSGTSKFISIEDRTSFKNYNTLE